MDRLQVAVSQGYLPEQAFPFEISTKEGDKYLLSWSNSTLFFQKVLMTVSTQLYQGRSLKKLVNDSTNFDELNDINDNR